VTNRYDIGIIGAGLIGLATADAVSRAHRDASIIVVDQADRVAAHQSSHNSGVIHSGLYYAPGSLKASLCVAGRDLMYSFCDEYGIPHHRSGKLVIASDPSEIPALDELERRGRANGLAGMTRLDAAGIREVEPEAVGITALHVPDAGVVDYSLIAEALASNLTDRAVAIATGTAVVGIEHGETDVTIQTDRDPISTGVLINCAGLHSDRVASMAGIEPSVRIVPFRGEYYRLSDDAAGLVRSLIYPVPDPRFPFLGVHFTRRIDGTVEVGPNAVLALGREHYRDAPPDWKDVRETLRFRGFRRLAWTHWRSGTRELVRSRSGRLYARDASRLVPGIKADHLLPGGAGVRAQAVTADGALVDDFVIERAGRTIHVVNAPSPGATACLAIGRHIADELDDVIRR
jgi:L-2-hydroxyglutarate oxidase LhgO